MCNFIYIYTFIGGRDFFPYNGVVNSYRYMEKYIFLRYTRDCTVFLYYISGQIKEKT